MSCSPSSFPDPRFVRLRDLLRSSRTIVDLGSGARPVEGATAAVDAFLDPEQRGFGSGGRISADEFTERGIRFVHQRIDQRLPFADKEFDFAYSHHVFEHVEDPASACSEMARVARAGAIVTPSIFAEIAFGRPYHRWLVADRGDTVYFFEKRPEEDRPFGNHPVRTASGGWMATPETNPFDIALNDGNWHHGPVGEEFGKLRGRIRDLWYAHARAMEMVFLWEGRFSWVVARESDVFAAGGRSS